MDLKQAQGHTHNRLTKAQCGSDNDMDKGVCVVAESVASLVTESMYGRSVCKDESQWPPSQRLRYQFLG